MKVSLGYSLILGVYTALILAMLYNCVIRWC
jgi:hypothetical protein